VHDIVPSQEYRQAVVVVGLRLIEVFAAKVNQQPCVEGVVVYPGFSRKPRTCSCSAS
jgi:hypothetical protein